MEHGEVDVAEAETGAATERQTEALAVTFDRIQHRYGGYTDEYLLSLPYARLVQMAEVATDREIEERRQRLRDQAFFAYRINPPIDEQREAIPYDQYLRNLGLADEPRTPEDPEQAKASALRRAEEIRRMDRERRQGEEVN